MASSDCTSLALSGIMLQNKNVIVVEGALIFSSTGCYEGC